MNGLGSYIREARLARGVDLREAAQETRIAMNFLKAIEDEDFSKLPGEVFVRGFLKNYARYLRLPEDEVMRRYADRVSPAPAVRQAAGKTAHTPAAAEAAPPSAADQPSLKAASRPNFELYLLAGGIVIAVAALLFVVLPARHSGRDRGAAVRSTVTSTDRTVTAPVATQAAPKEPEKLYLDIVALEDLWVLVRTDSSPQKKAVLKKGETVTWSADARFVLSYSSAGAAKILLNGKELEASGAKDAVVRDLTITANGIAAQKVEPGQIKPRPPKQAKPPEAKLPQGLPLSEGDQARPLEQLIPRTEPVPAAAPTATAAASPPKLQMPGVEHVKMPWEQ